MGTAEQQKQSSTRIWLRMEIREESVMDNQFEQRPVWQPEEPGKKGRSGFGIGVLVGVLSTLMVVLVLGTVLAGVYTVSRKNAGGGPEGPVAAENENIPGTDGQTTTINTDLITQSAMIDSYLDDYFMYEVDREELRDGMLMGMVASLGDPYSEYYDEEALRSFQDSTEGEYVGIGAAVTQERSSGIVRIARPYEGTPSAQAGLLPRDVIIAVDDTDVTGMELNQVVSLIKGEEGTTVMMHIYRESEEEYLDIEVVRAKVEIPTVIARMLEGNIGYLEVTGFDGVTANQFISSYEALKSQGMEAVIVDLRDNGGGLVDIVEEMLDYLLPEGTIFYAQDKNGVKSMVYDSDAEAALDIPMVVLVNGNTASASEIFSGNIQAFGMGTIVGTTTYGKGVMQQLFYTNEEHTAAVKLTVADYYINGDKNVNGGGIVPDVEEELSEEAAGQIDLADADDNQLQKGIEVLKEQMAGN